MAVDERVPVRPPRQVCSAGWMTKIAQCGIVEGRDTRSYKKLRLKMVLV